MEDEGYAILVRQLTSERVQEYFSRLGVTSTRRFEMPNLLALNFVLYGILNGGGSSSLRIDAQGKALGQALLQISLNNPSDEI